MPSSSKATSDYWKDHLARRKNSKGEELPDYYVQFRIDRVPTWFNLGTSKKVNASKKAAEIWNYYNATKDGPATLRKFRDGTKADVKPSDERLTVGQYFRAFEAADINISPESYNTYRVKLYRFIADIKGIKSETKFDYFNGNDAKYRARIEAVHLDIITPEVLEKWKRNYVRRAANEGRDSEKAANTANSILRNNRALFAKKHIRKLRDLKDVHIPADFRNPFEDVDLQAAATRLYVSDIADPSQLIQNAKEHFLVAIPRKNRNLIAEAQTLHQSYRIFILGITAGLRRKEIDGLLWEEVDFENSCIHIKTNKWRALKSKRNSRVISLSDGVMNQLKEWKETAKGIFVVESPTEPRTLKEQLAGDRKRTWYRCHNAGTRLIAWLREQGIERPQAIHELRKEFGQQIYEKTGDIFKASTALGHVHVQTTVNSYVERKSEVAVDYF